MTKPSRINWRVLAVVGLLVAHFVLAVSSKLHESTTSDELVHVTAGTAYWKYNDYRLQPENGNLPQRWEAIPAWLSHAPFPTLDQAYWKVSDVWVMGHEFFYETGHDHFPMLMRARAMVALLSVATGLLIYSCTRRLFGEHGAFVSLVFFSFSPTFLAHGALATSDACIALFMLASALAWWRHLERPTPATFAVSVLMFGLACVSKYSAVLLLPILGICAAAHLSVQRGRLRGVALSAAGHAIGAWALIWAFYGFKYAASGAGVPPAAQFIQDWPIMYAQTGSIGRLIHVMADHHVLPEAFLYGAAYVVETSRARGAYLNGELSVTGWHTFFIWAYLLKTTVAFILASSWGLWSALRERAAPAASKIRAVLPFTPLLALFTVYWLFSLQSHLNIGQRHLLPVYPVLFIFAGALGPILERPLRLAGFALVGLLVWHVAESAAIYPHYIAYFNEIGGGPSRGYTHLVDSSLDWGQDMPGLADWLNRNQRPGENAYLSYVGTAEPRYYHMNVKRLAYLCPFQEDEPYIPLSGGLYCVSATMLEQVYSSVQGPWTPGLEREFVALRALEPMFDAYEKDPVVRARVEKEVGRKAWIEKRDRFLHLRFSRLCYVLRVRKPDAVIGYSIFVYRLSPAEATAATAGPIRDWIALIERSGEEAGVGK